MASRWIGKHCTVETNKTDELCMNFLLGYLALRHVVFLFLIYLLLLSIFTVLHWSSRYLVFVDSLGTSQRYHLFHRRAFVCSSLNEVVSFQGCLVSIGLNTLLLFVVLIFPLRFRLELM